MGLTFIILLAIGLAMDCFSVSLTAGIVEPRAMLRQRLLMALLFGLFQAAMPLIGWLAGYHFARQIMPIDHWLAFGILLLIGGKMIIESIKGGEENTRTSYYSCKTLLLLSVATSIDALATGLIFVGHNAYMWLAVSVIGMVSVIFSLAGSYIGTYFKKKFTFKMEILGGIILIAIGTKILIEHLFFQ